MFPYPYNLCYNLVNINQETNLRRRNSKFSAVFPKKIMKTIDKMRKMCIIATNGTNKGNYTLFSVRKNNRTYKAHGNGGSSLSRRSRALFACIEGGGAA